jgi:hypothetical protein
MNLQRLTVAAVMLTVSFAAIPSIAEAARYRTPTGQVVHTRRLPVALHRAVPPQHGKHIYAGR